LVLLSFTRQCNTMQLTPSTLPDIQRALADANLDGWLLYDFRGTNPIAATLLGLEGMLSRRVFVLVPRSGEPVAITHAIEQGPWKTWPREWKKVVYSGWRTLESSLAEMVRGKRVAMEYSARDSVPYLDRIPAGVVELVRAADAEVESSNELVSRFFAGWTGPHLESHRRAAEALAAIAGEVMRECGRRARTQSPASEYEAMEWIGAAFASRRLITDHGPNVSVGANAANPHYEPEPNASSRIGRNSVLLVDLWAHEDGGMWADQTWMAWIGDAPVPNEVMRVWETVRDARDAAITDIRRRLGARETARGADADDAARAVIESRGYGKHIWHRTGHSIDIQSLHGSGPNIDNLETRDDRRLLDGCGFSIEPGVYITGEFGVRSEVNAVVWNGELIVTPGKVQTDLLLV
jgi:Xaa-Pro dipeptidase